MTTDQDTNGSFRQRTVKAGYGVMVCAEQIHRVAFSDGAVVKCHSYGPVEPDFPIQGETKEAKGFILTGIYSDKELKVIKCKSKDKGKNTFPVHSHPGNEWIEVVKGSIVIYCYKALTVGLLFFILNSMVG